MQEPRVGLNRGRCVPRAGSALWPWEPHILVTGRNHWPKLNYRLKGKVRALEGDKSRCQNLKTLRSHQKGEQKGLGRAFREELSHVQNLDALAA